MAGLFMAGFFCIAAARLLRLATPSSRAHAGICAACKARFTCTTMVRNLLASAGALSFCSWPGSMVLVHCFDV